MDQMLIVVLCLLVPGFLTGIGAVPIFFTRAISRKWLDIMLGFAAGVMLAATSFSLIIPSIEYGGGTFKAVIITGVGILAGGVMLDLIDKFSPHEHLLTHQIEGTPSDSFKKIWLFIIAITIHNFPEGLAVGVGLGTDNIANGIAIATGIGLQNMPEGLAVAVSLMREGYTRKKSWLIALATGLVEPVGAVIGLLLVHTFKPILPFVLALAAGAMLFVISDEIIPETHGGDHERQSTYGLMIGFVVMMVMDVLLG